MFVVWSIGNIKEAKNVMFWFLKKTYQRWKTHYSNGFCKIYQEIRKLLWPISVKWTLWWTIAFGREIKVGLDDQSFCWVCFSMSIRLRHSCFIKGQTSKGAFLLVLLDLRFHIKVLGNVLKKLWAVEHHCVVYHLSV